MINMDTRKPADLLSLHGGDIVDYIETEKGLSDREARSYQSEQLYAGTFYGCVL